MPIQAAYFRKQFIIIYFTEAIFRLKLFKLITGTLLLLRAWPVRPFYAMVGAHQQLRSIPDPYFSCFPSSI
jgi:hypothetical protein